MAFNDSDFISKEEHELDYVLKKWGKRGTGANRQTLIKALDEFNRDPAYPAHTRKDFYAWAEGKAFMNALESSSGSSDSSRAGSTVASERKLSQRSTDGGKKKMPWWLWLIIAIVVILVVLFFLRSCDSCSANKARAVAASANAQLVAPATETTTVPEPSAPVAPASTAAPLARTLDLSGIPIDALTIRFKPDSGSELADGYAEKLAALAAILSPFDVGSIVLTGHSASVGYPKGEMLVSEARAKMVADYLRKAGLASGITVQTVGKGAQEPMGLGDRALNRRVVLSLE